MWPSALLPSALPRQRIELLFDETFYIEASFECRFDHIEVRDGPFSFSPLINRFCGSATPGLVLSSGRFMWIRFFSDEELEGIGFRVQYSFTAGDQNTAGRFIVSPRRATFSPHLLNRHLAHLLLVKNASLVMHFVMWCLIVCLYDFPPEDPEFHLHIGGLLNPIPGRPNTQFSLLKQI